MLRADGPLVPVEAEEHPTVPTRVPAYVLDELFPIVRAGGRENQQTPGVRDMGGAFHA